MLDFGSTALPDRYWAKVYPEPNTGCWLWSAAVDRKGYGRVGVGQADQGTTGAHVWMCRLTHGPKPSPSHMVLHQCDTPPCVNPHHIKWGTAAENSAQMVARGHSTRLEFCKRGHELSSDNRYDYGACKKCARYRARERSMANA